MKRVLVTGASGFVGKHLRVALRAVGVEARLGTRNPGTMASRDPGQDWVHFDTSDSASMERALEGCDAAFFLIHQVGARRDYTASESEAARAFSAAAAGAGIKRVVYLGGVAPDSARSRHLKSRKRTGEILRAAETPCVEMRAAMIIGEGSASWKMVTDLARRLPAMVLPRWLANHSWPVGIEDVVFALMWSLFCETPVSACFDLPGPERISHRAMLLRVAEASGHHPVMMGVPVLSPRLSSYWIGLVTSVDFALARELVEGLVTDLDPTDAIAWDHVGQSPTALDVAIQRALDDAESRVIPSPSTRERLDAIGRSFREERFQEEQAGS